MTFTEHLEELRTRLILSVAFLSLGFVVGMFFARPAVNLLSRPLAGITLQRATDALQVRLLPDGMARVMGLEEHADPSSFFDKVSTTKVEVYLPETPQNKEPDFVFGYDFRKPVFFSPLDPVMLYFKAAFFLGLIVALPFILLQAWLFIAPGLTGKEKQIAIPILALGSVLFPMGAAFAYFMLRLVLNFLLNFQIINMEPLLEINRFVTFELRIMLGFGVTFELPLVIMFLTFLGIVEPRQLRKYRPHAIVVIALVSMLFTPPDPITMLLMMGPLVILYEVSIWLSIPLARRRAAEWDLDNEDDRG